MVIKKKSWILGIFLLGICLSFLLIYNVNASVYFTQPNSVYNLGDAIDLNMSIDSIVDSPFKLRLFCNERSIEIFSGPAIENLVLPLNSRWINDLKGSCYFQADYNGETKRTTPDFIISNKLSIILETDSFFAKPDQVLDIRGNVTRANGAGEYGEIEISVPFKGAVSSQTSENQTLDNSTSENESSNASVSSASDFDKFYGKIIKGEFLVSLKLPSNVASGDYGLVINAYDKSDSGAIINSGSMTGKLKVPQVLTSIDFAINNQIFDPGQNITIKPSLLDQANQVITDSTFVIITNTEGEKVYDKIIDSGETGIYEIPFDLTSGYYSVEASNGEEIARKSVFVNEKAKIYFEIRNNTIYLKNIGNTKYNKEVQIDINGKPFIEKVQLDIGEEKELYLSGDNKNYSVKVSDGDSSLDANVLLTGKAIDVRDFKGIDFSNLSSNPLLWIFFTLLIIVIITLILKKLIKRKSIARPEDYYGKPKHLRLDGVLRKEAPKSKQEIKKEVIKRKIEYVPIVPPTEAVQGFVTKGHRNTSVIIALKIKNKITPFARDYVQKSIHSIYSKKGAVYEHGEYVIGILSPISTKTFKNEVDGTKASEHMCNFLLDYNSKFKEPIEFGIGVNSGEIINEVKDGKLLFTALGNSVVFAKKLAELAKNEVLLSESVYHKGMPEIQADKKSFGDITGFKIKKVVDYEKNRKFIDDFLKRAEHESGVKYVRNGNYLSRNMAGSGMPNASNLVKDSKKFSINNNSIVNSQKTASISNNSVYNPQKTANINNNSVNVQRMNNIGSANYNNINTQNPIKKEGFDDEILKFGG